MEILFRVAHGLLPFTDWLYLDARGIGLARRLNRQRLEEPMGIGRKRAETRADHPAVTRLELGEVVLKKSYATGSGRVSRYSATMAATCTKN